MKKSILLIEDDPFLIDIYITKLEEAGFSVDVANSGDQGLKMIRKTKPDLLLLDIVLPQISGWEILESIKQDKKLKNLKVIVLSNLGQKDEVKKGLRFGAMRYLIKAYYTPSQVVEEIREVLK
ncbi:MAG: response regulator [Patescibacteria group bacterium]|nr:response regulator [Patescibacteria group bacterium]